MSINLLKTVQQNLGYPELQKIDPNTQVMIVDVNTPDEDKFSQAAIPAVITGLFQYTQSDEGAAAVLQNDNSTSWINEIFGDIRTRVIKTISAYASLRDENTTAKMNAIAIEAIKSVQENLPANATIQDVKKFLANQKSNTLLYLPAVLNMGGLLENNVLDDETNKMEGPVSSLIRNIGEAFTSPDTGEVYHKFKADTSKNDEHVY